MHECYVIISGRLVVKAIPLTFNDKDINSDHQGHVYTNGRDRLDNEKVTRCSDHSGGAAVLLLQVSPHGGLAGDHPPAHPAREPQAQDVGLAVLLRLGPPRPAHQAADVTPEHCAL